MGLGRKQGRCASRGIVPHTLCSAGIWAQDAASLPDPMTSATARSGAAPLSAKGPETDHPPRSVAGKCRSTVPVIGAVLGTVNPALKRLAGTEGVGHVEVTDVSEGRVDRPPEKRRASMTTKVWLENGQTYTVRSVIKHVHVEWMDEDASIPF